MIRLDSTSTSSRSKVRIVYVCVCKAIRLSEAVEAARAEGADPEDLIETLGFYDDECCGRCAGRISEISVMVRLELNKSTLGLATA